jgi:hypothetical protein
MTEGHTERLNAAQANAYGMATAYPADDIKHVQNKVRKKRGTPVSTDDGDVWDRALKTLDEGSSHVAERSALKAQFTAYVAERSACEAKGTVPRGVRRRGERLLEEVSALEERADPVADRGAAEAVTDDDGAKKATDATRRRGTGGGDTKPQPPPPPSSRGTRPPSRGRGG